MTELRAVEADIRTAAARSGLHPLTLTLISPLGARKGTRYAYRVDGRDGTFKARHFGSEEEALRVYELRLQLNEAFAPVLARCGAVLLEAWVEGEMLDDHDVDAWIPHAGDILGRLHSQPLGSEIVRSQQTRRWTDAANDDAKLLHDAGIVTPAERARIAAALQCHDPGSTTVALIHKDFCAENMLIDTSGRLRIIDTEQLAIEPAGFDVAWTWHRWPMPEISWARFMDAYRRTGSVVEAESYWRIITGLTLSRVFFQRMPERLEAQLARLRRCTEQAS